MLSVHGGPAGTFTRTFTVGYTYYPLQALQAKRFFVLRPNPRGSGGYGWEHRSAITADWGGLDYEDVMAGVDHVIALGLADPERLGVTGWSYGGFMTSLIITKTDRFKVAAPGAGMSNMISFVGTTDIFGFIPGWFRGEPWENREFYMERSAVFNIEKVTTPTLILFGKNDARVPVSQGYEFYRALQRRGVDVQLVLYPRSGHGVGEPRLVVDLMNRLLDFFVEKLNP